MGGSRAEAMLPPLLSSAPKLHRATDARSRTILALLLAGCLRWLGAVPLRCPAGRPGRGG